MGTVIILILSKYLSSGDLSTVNIIIPSSNRVNLTSLSLHLVDESGHPLGAVDLATPNLVGTFVPPLAPFKLKLSGTTAAGRPFQRISRRLTTAKNLLLRLQGGQGYNTLKCGKPLRLSFALDYNGERRERFDVVVNSSLTTGSASTTTIQARYRRIVQNTLRDREVFFTVWLTPRGVTSIRDEWVTIKVTVKKKPVVSQADLASFTDRVKVTCSAAQPGP